MVCYLLRELRKFLNYKNLRETQGILIFFSSTGKLRKVLIFVKNSGNFKEF